MSNTYFDHPASPSRLQRRTLAQSGDVNDLLDQVTLGFDKVQVKDLATLHGPDGETIGALPAAATRANKSLYFDAAGDPQITIAASSAEMAAAVAAAAAADVSADAAAVDAATLAGTTNALHIMQLAIGVI